MPRRVVKSTNLTPSKVNINKIVTTPVTNITPHEESVALSSSKIEVTLNATDNITSTTLDDEVVMNCVNPGQTETIDESVALSSYRTKEPDNNDQLTTVNNDLNDDFNDILNDDFNDVVEDVIESVNDEPVEEPNDEIVNEPSINYVDKFKTESELTNKSVEIFKKYYGDTARKTKISAIIDGDIIKIHPNNINIHEVASENEKLRNEVIMLAKRYCNLDLYDYQIDAIVSLVKMEQDGKYVAKDGKEIISNGWLLKLPVGSGKSVVFQFLALFWRTSIPKHPIIISIDGSKIPDNERIGFRDYPHYYESCQYSPKESYSVAVLDHYRYRNITIIITYTHLMQQLAKYFVDNFKREVFSTFNPKSGIRVACETRTVTKEMVDNCDVLAITCSNENMRKLAELSRERPFKRIIIDDYTSLPSLDTFRQIWATSTIFVSGSGFDRPIDTIPSCYYSLKNTDHEYITFVGDPEKTLKGVIRDNIATIKLVGTDNTFNSYQFVKDVEEKSMRVFKTDPIKCYPLFTTKGTKTCEYLKYCFIISNAHGIANVIRNIETDQVDEKLIPNYLKWKESVKDSTLFNTLLKDESIFYRTLSKESLEMINTSCYNCQSNYGTHCGFGVISLCCGAYYCRSCVSVMSTKRLQYDNKIITDKVNSYCVSCRTVNPKFIPNVLYHRDNDIPMYNVIKQHFETKEFEKCLQGCDYVFYILNEGLVPKDHNGRPVNITIDMVERKLDLESIKTSIPKIDVLYSKDQIAIASIRVIEECYRELGLKSSVDSYILIYNCPPELHNRINHAFMTSTRNPNEILRKRKGKQTNNEESNNQVSPLCNTHLIFHNTISSLIGLHRNIIAIIQWTKPREADELVQLSGRIMRINTWDTPLYFYITCTTLADNYLLDDH